MKLSLLKYNRTGGSKVKVVEAVILPEVTTEVPLTSMPFNNCWKHLSNLQLADPDFGTLGNIDFILGAKVFSCALSYRHCSTHQVHPSTFKMAF